MTSHYATRRRAENWKRGLIVLSCPGGGSRPWELPQSKRVQPSLRNGILQDGLPAVRSRRTASVSVATGARLRRNTLCSCAVTNRKRRGRAVAPHVPTPGRWGVYRRGGRPESLRSWRRPSCFAVLNKQNQQDLEDLKMLEEKFKRIFMYWWRTRGLLSIITVKNRARTSPNGMFLSSDCSKWKPGQREYHRKRLILQLCRHMLALNASEMLKSKLKTCFYIRVDLFELLIEIIFSFNVEWFLFFGVSFKLTNEFPFLNIYFIILFSP